MKTAGLRQNDRRNRDQTAGYCANSAQRYSDGANLLQLLPHRIDEVDQQQPRQKDPNAAGNGQASAKIPPEVITEFGLHGATIGVVWTIMVGDDIHYQTGCTTAVLD